MNIIPSEYKKIVPGLSLGNYKVTPTNTQLFMFSAITWNRHQIHFDRDRAEAEGFPNVAVQRGLIGNFLSEFIVQWLSDHGHMKNLQWKVLQSTYPGIEIKCSGTVISITDNINGKEIHCNLKVENEKGFHIAEGEAKLQIYN